ncbi:MAG: YggS family pyridoxal phosphate-dependent enzyme [Gammaproteobacteria bacterium]|nr:MAG: YggS family pyridoxal phosphate-dependent enzyme [Gammaproteobacteria bacterium]
MQDLQLLKVKKLITEYEQKYQRAPHAVTLLAVSKGQPVEKIEALFHAGQVLFGESYVQEALPKIHALADKPIEWHFIGPIQSNKTRKIAEHFTWVHSVDAINIAKRLNDQRPAHLPPLNICLEVNINHETTKSGVLPEDVSSLATYCTALPRLRLRGLMAIPAKQSTFTAQRETFHSLFLLWQSLRHQGFALDTLSMGMSNDFEAAIAEGSTLVRIGTAIFG